MNGAQSLIRTLVGGGVNVCFANPGTSEMHFVASLDAVPEMRAVLALFEGVVTGAADGYGRVAERPAATLLHMGPGLANGLANLHNARRAHTPIVNVIGDHARYHKGFDAPLESDIESLTGWLEGWSRTSTDPMSVGRDAAEAIAAACTPGPDRQPGTASRCFVVRRGCGFNSGRAACTAPCGRRTDRRDRSGRDFRRADGATARPRSDTRARAGGGQPDR